MLLLVVVGIAVAGFVFVLGANYGRQQAGSGRELRRPTAFENAEQHKRDLELEENHMHFNALGHVDEGNPTVPAFVPLIHERGTSRDMLRWSRHWYDTIRRRRSTRDIATDIVPLEVIENIMRAAGTAPSGANCQPWSFCVVASRALKQFIREKIEAEERINYERRMSRKWVGDLKALATNWEKPYLTEAPYICVVFKQTSGTDPRDGTHVDHYYTEISASIAVGFLVTAIHQAGLCTVVTTPMNAGPAIREALNRPKTEKVLVLLPVGLPKNGSLVPNLVKKPLRDVFTLYQS